MRRQTTADAPPEGGPPRRRLVYHGKFVHQAAPKVRKTLDSDASGSALALADHAARNGDFPAARVDVYRRDVVVRKSVRIVPPKGGKTEGAVITEFSDESMRAFIFLAKNCDCDFPSMLTLTYPANYPADGKLVKRHLHNFRRVFERRYKKRALWFLEFQKRGAPHFHLLCEVDLRECGDGDLVCKRRNGKRRDQSYLTCPDEERWASQRWFEIVGSGDEKHLWAGVAWEVVEKTDGALRYAAAHGAKRAQKQVPGGYLNVGRFWGKIGEIRLERVGVATVDSVGVFEAVGSEALSSRGRIKKYLYDASGKFSLDEL